MRYFFHTSYNGAAYRGWQRQPNAYSVQAIIEDRLSSLLKTKCAIMGCGRTDALVHASQFFFHLDMDLTPNETFLFTLNKILPADIVIHDIVPVSDRNHAQHSAEWRTYDYFIHTEKDPFLGQFSTFYPNNKLDHGSMKVALELLLKYNDYRAFCITPDRHKSTLCNIKSVALLRNKDASKLRVQMTANRFLRGMIRIIVGNLLEVGAGNLSIAGFENLLISGKSGQFLNQAYPQGLYLSKITYPFLDLPSITDHFMMYHCDELNYWQSL